MYMFYAFTQVYVLIHGLVNKALLDECNPFYRGTISLEFIHYKFCRFPAGREIITG